MLSDRILTMLAGATALATAAFVAVAPQAITPAQAQAPRSPWASLAPFPEPSEEVLGAEANGKFYVFAGLGPNWSPMALVYEFDPAGNKWTKKQPMPIASHHVAFTTLNGKIYGFGGFKLPESGPAMWVPIDNAWEYDPANDSWKALAAVPQARGAGQAAAVNGKLYFVGGAAGPGKGEGLNFTKDQGVTGRVDEYDPATNTWTQKASMPTPRNHHVVQAANNKIYAIGGRIGAAFIGMATNIDVVEEYDPATDHWSPPKAKMPTARSASGSGALNGKIYVAGGEFNDARMFTAYRVVEAYDAASNSWATLPPMRFPRHGLAAAVVGSRLHVASGDVQSAGNGGHVHVEYHDALELAPATR